MRSFTPVRVGANLTRAAAELSNTRAVMKPVVGLGRDLSCAGGRAESARAGRGERAQAVTREGGGGGGGRVSSIVTGHRASKPSANNAVAESIRGPAG